VPVILEQLIYLNVQSVLKYSSKSESAIFRQTSEGKKYFFVQNESLEENPVLKKNTPPLSPNVIFPHKIQTKGYAIEFNFSFNT